jgi:hypothetical protein
MQRLQRNVISTSVGGENIAPVNIEDEIKRALPDLVRYEFNIILTLILQ